MKSSRKFVWIVYGSNKNDDDPEDLLKIFSSKKFASDFKKSQEEERDIYDTEYSFVSKLRQIHNQSNKNNHPTNKEKKAEWILRKNKLQQEVNELYPIPKFVEGVYNNYRIVKKELF